MANLVDKATSDALMGPDWAMNLEICDMINGDPRRAKDVVKAIKKRMGNKNPKVQILALTVLETIVKNCGDVVQQQVADRDILREMVKICKKKRDMQVRDKILTLLEGWQEAFGGPRGRYPQYFMAFDELRRSGVPFPEQAESLAPIFTPRQTQPITSYSSLPHRSPNYTPSILEASTASDLPGLSLTEIKNIRGGMDVLMEMLNAMDPHNKKALQTEVIVELVEQCRMAQRRVTQLVNSTSDEELLRQGLALNDDLQRVFEKHGAIASGSTMYKEGNLSAPPTQLLDVNHGQGEKDDSLSHRSMSKVQPQDQGHDYANGSHLALPAPPQLPKMASPATTREQLIDLLSGDPIEEKHETSALANSVVAQYTQSPKSTPTQQGKNFSSNSPFFQPTAAATPFDSFSLQHQQQETYVMPNSANSDRSLMVFPQQSNQQFQPPVQFQEQSYNQFHDTNYIVPWARPSGQPLSSLQQTLIYGNEQKPQAMSPQSSQLLLTYNTQAPTSQFVSQKGYRSQLLLPQAYGSSKEHPYQQVYNSSQLQIQPMYGSPQVQGQQHFSLHLHPIHGHLPPAPWNTENTQTIPLIPQQSVLFYSNMVVPVLSSPVQFSERQQLVMTAEQKKAVYAGQVNLASHMQNLALRGGGYYMPGQSGQHLQHQVDVPSYQRQISPLKDVKPEDKLFKELVDFAKNKNIVASNK